MSRTKKPSSNKSDQSIPEWFFALHAYLVRDRDLDPRSPDQDGNPTGPRGAHHLHLTRLANNLHNYECPRYAEWLWTGNDTGPNPHYAEYKAALPRTNPAPEEEPGALRAVLKWLDPPFYYPQPRADEGKREIRELRRSLERAVMDRLKVLESSQGDGPCAPNRLRYRDKDCEMENIPWRLLSALWGKENAPIGEIAERVWGHDESEDAIKSALQKVNRALEEVGARWTYGRKAGYFVKI